MTARLITPPAALAVSLADAKMNLRIEADDTAVDSLITAWIAGITGHAEHYMGRSIINQTWRITFDAFSDALKLPNPPVVSVDSVKYLDADGAEQTMAPADYVVSAGEPVRIVPAYGVTWPSTYSQIDAVTVDVVCGYGADSTSTPNEIKLYILAKLVEQFDPAIRVEKDTVQASFIDRLLDRHRVYA